LEAHTAQAWAAAAAAQSVSTGPHRRLTVGSGVDDDVVVALVLHDNAVEVRKGGRVGHNIEGVLSVADGVW
jgi:hypothetical protein